MPVCPEATSHDPGSEIVHLTMLGTDPARQPARQAATGRRPAEPCVGYGTRATPSRTTASAQRRHRGEMAAVPSRIRPRMPRAA